MARKPPPNVPTRLKSLQSRDDYLALTGLELEALNSMRRRDQVPLKPAAELTNRQADERGWSPYSAFALIVALELAGMYQISRQRAAEIASRSLLAASRWSDISATSAQQADGHNPDFHVLFASIALPGVRPTKKHPDPTIAVGTLGEIAAGYPMATDIVAVSATRCAALMRQRAARAKIDLSEFWEH